MGASPWHLKRHHKTCGSTKVTKKYHVGLAELNKKRAREALERRVAKKKILCVAQMAKWVNSGGLVAAEALRAHDISILFPLK